MKRRSRLQQLVCNDKAHPGSDELDGVVRQLETSTSHFVGSTLETYVTCTQWPLDSTRPEAPTAEDAPPILVIGVTHDPSTPYPWSRRWSRSCPPRRC